MNSADPGSDTTLARLDTARHYALAEPSHYDRIVPGVLGIINSTTPIAQQRWGTGFLAETFASPVLPEQKKQDLIIKVLPTLQEYFETQVDDVVVIKNAVQAATSVYPLVFRYAIYNPTDVVTWQHMATIKSYILRRMDSWPPGVKVCCIKFIQRVVQVQTPASNADPRRPDHSDISLALVPKDHPLIPPPNLEPEASGLLDRLLNVFQEEHSDALFVTATLNCIGILLRTRPQTSSRILSAVLSFNPFKGVVPPLSGRVQVAVRSMERTVKSFLTNMNKRNPNHAQTGRVQGYLDRLQQTRLELLDESRKRLEGGEPMDGIDEAKASRLNAEISDASASSDRPAFPPLPLGPVTIAQLFTLTTDEGHKNFDAKQIPESLISRLVVPVLQSIDQNQLTQSLNAVRSRYLSLSDPKNMVGVESDENAALASPDSAMEVEDMQIEEVNLGPVVIPQPPPLNPLEVDELSKFTVSRILSLLNTLDDPSATAANKASASRGFYRLAATTYDRDSWVTVLSRLATRPFVGLDIGPDMGTIVKKEEEEGGTMMRNPHRYTVADGIREALFIHILQDFRRRIDVAISWLNEEWYSDRLHYMAMHGLSAPQIDLEHPPPAPHFKFWCLRLLDTLVTYLDAKDRLLIRFFSEIPEIDREILDRIKRVADDPERVTLAIMSLQYLIMFRVPVRDICIDAVEDLWRNNDSAKAQAAKVLAKYRPAALGGAVAAASAQRGGSSDVKSPPPNRNLNGASAALAAK